MFYYFKDYFPDFPTNFFRKPCWSSCMEFSSNSFRIFSPGDFLKNFLRKFTRDSRFSFKDSSQNSFKHFTLNSSKNLFHRDCSQSFQTPCMLSEVALRILSENLPRIKSSNLFRKFRKFRKLKKNQKIQKVRKFSINLLRNSCKVSLRNFPGIL